MSLVRDVLATKDASVCTIGPDKTVLDAAVLMNHCRIGALVVLDGEKIAGIFTERDVMNRVVAEKKDAETTTVREVMTTKVAFCEQDTTLETCRGVMTKHKIRHLPVVENGKLLGMISSGDILARRIAEHEETIKYLHEYMQGPN
jgi:CBS domain-containing protein